MNIQNILKLCVWPSYFALIACSHTADITLVGQEEVASIVKEKLSTEPNPPRYLTNLESKNLRNPDGYFAYYLVSDDKISKIIDRNGMHALFYKVVECDDPAVQIYGDRAYRLTTLPLGLETKPSEEYFGAYIPKRYPEFFELLNRDSHQQYKPSYGNLDDHCFYFSAGAMTGSSLKSNLIQLDGK